MSSPEEVVVEAIAQKYAQYLQMSAEDSEALSREPTIEDGLSISQHAALPTLREGQSADEFLQYVDGEIAKRSPPATYGDRCVRLQLVATALATYNQHKLVNALQNRPDLVVEVHKRKADIMAQWYKDVFSRIRDAPRQPPATFIRERTPGPAVATSTTGGNIPEDVIAAFLENPETLVGKKGICNPPPDLDEDEICCKGLWQIVKYAVYMEEDQEALDIFLVNEEFWGDKCPVPVGRGEVEEVLRYSTLVE